MDGISNRYIRLYLLHNNSSVHLTTIAEVPRFWRITDETWKVGEHYETPYFYLRPTLLEWPCKEQRGSGSIASAPVSHVSAPVYTNGVWLLLRLVSVAPKIKPLTIVVFQCPFHRPPHGAQPDGSG